MQLRQLAALERQKIIDGLAELERLIADLATSWPTRPGSARSSPTSSPRSSTGTATTGVPRSSPPTATSPWRTSSPTRTWWSRSPAAATPSAPGPTSTAPRSGAGRACAARHCAGDDVVQHFIATSNHHWLLFFTTAGRVYRTKAYNLPEASRDARGGHVAGLLSFQPDEAIAQVLAIRDYEQAPYLVLATRHGLVKKTRLGDYNSPRQAGVIAINFREDDDELIGAELVGPRRRHPAGVAARAVDPVPGRRHPAATDGPRHVGGLGHEVPRRRLGAVDVGDPALGRRRRRRGGDARARRQQFLFTMTDGGFAKRSRIDDYRLQSRGGIGIKAMSLTNEDRGGLVGGVHRRGG